MRTLAFFVAVAVIAPVSAFAQGILVINNDGIRLPRVTVPPTAMRYEIQQILIEGQIDNQLADIQVSQKFHNSGSGTIEAQFIFPLPYDGAIDSLTLMVNGEELTAKLLPADEARTRYQDIVRSKKDPALLEWIGTGMFQTSVFPIPAGETRTVTITYQQLLRNQDQLTEFMFPLSTAQFTSQPVQQVRFRLNINSDSPLQNIYSPTHSLKIDRPTEKRATVSFEKNNVVPSEDFRLFFNSSDDSISATLLTHRPTGDEDGYFLLLASPKIPTDGEKHQAKTVVFVVDKSGSMSGQKIEQAKEAAKFILNNLRKGDQFNIISYDSKVESFSRQLQEFNSKTRAEALAYVDGLFAGGGTNIHDSLTSALSGLSDSKLPNYILFMTDGRPTSGEQNEGKIAAAVKAANSVNARLLTFGVGYDVNSRLLDRLSRDNHGLGEYVRPDEDIEEYVSKVFQRISSPVLTNAELTFDFDDSSPGQGVNRVTPSGSLDLFSGEQLVVVGRFKKFGAAKIRLTGSIRGEKQEFTFSGKFRKKIRSDSNPFIAKLWATRRIGELIDELDLNGKNEELINELVMLSTKFGILTPYTSFLADETVRPELASDSNRRLSTLSLSTLEEAEGRRGFAQRGLKQRFKVADGARVAEDSYVELLAESGSDSFGLGAPSDSLSIQPAAERPKPSPSSFRSRLSRSSGYGGLPGPSDNARPAYGGGLDLNQSQVVESKEAAVQKLRTLIRRTGSQTLYQRGNLLVTPETANIDPDNSEAKIVKIKRFSDEYFKLSQQNTDDENELLALQKDDERLLIRLRGKVYLIE
ncbi:von Willebrand factor type A domain protein [Thalassoglobus neptunius]|uniref:von Willebrand factor type A domain protein n=1 Tax=Thalassoglobus neptunius TaxID=1938619 RepID=A0A5C5WQJ0_9PLAN|nr:VIT domain-containing protein [Thalassoglobus neptunius]TWT52313.1 von Willebrand factor type A domain protein [Thalassoglobus neptunius]